MSSPSKMICPEVGSRRRTRSRAVVLLPQPVSPTIPSVSPRLTSNEMSSTAFTAPICFWKTIPRVIGKCLTRFLTSTSGAPSALTGLPPGSSRWLPETGSGRASSTTRCRSCADSSPAARPLPDARAELGREQAGRLVSGVSGHRGQRRVDSLVVVEHVRAARVEVTARRPLDQARRPPRDRNELLVAGGVESRNRLQQTPGVRVLGREEDLLVRPTLDDSPRVHDRRSRRRTPRPRPGRG